MTKITDLKEDNIHQIRQCFYDGEIWTKNKLAQKTGLSLAATTNILQYLRPDQIYFAKWNKGYSKLLRLSNIYPNIREVNNIEKMYLASVFDDAINNNE